MNKLLDMTYWRLRRRLRKCGYCGERVSSKRGKVNFGVAFQLPKYYYHEQCLNEAMGVSTPNFPKPPKTRSN